MGPNGTVNRMLTDIDKGLQTTSKVKILKYSYQTRHMKYLNQQIYWNNQRTQFLVILKQVKILY